MIDSRRLLTVARSYRPADLTTPAPALSLSLDARGQQLHLLMRVGSQRPRTVAQARAIVGNIRHSLAVGTSLPSV